MIEPTTDGGEERDEPAQGDSINHDRAHNPTGYEDFINWHQQHGQQGRGVDLRWAHPEQAAQLKNRYRLPSSDVAIWERKYAVLYHPPQGDVIRPSIAFVGSDLYQRCLDYFNEIKRNSQPLPRATEPKVPPIGRLADIWEDYVSPKQRIDKLGPFLLNVLEPIRQRKGIILDAAAGIGCESVYLLKRDFTVVSNEIDVNLREKARQYAAKSGVELQLVDQDWLQLDRLPDNLRFDAILILGNSLCLINPNCPISPQDDRRLCISNFWKVLRDGGLIIVDERNFPYMLKCRDHILQNPVRNFRWSGEIMYCGQQYQGRPVDITDDRIIWRIHRNQPPVQDKDGINRQRVEPDLILYPFRPGELPKLLYDCGFRDIKVYADFEELCIYDERDPLDCDKLENLLANRGKSLADVDFFTHTAIKAAGQVAVAV